MRKNMGILPLIIFILASSFYFYEYFLQISPSVMTEGLMRDLNISAATLGSVSAFYYYTYTIFQIPAGLLFDRFGARIILTTMVLVCSTGAYLFSVSNNIALASVGRLLMGTGSAFAFVGTLFLILRWFPAKYFAVLAGVAQLMGSMGAIFGTTPLAKLTELLGWHHALQLMSAVGLCLALLIALIVRNKPKGYIEPKSNQKKPSMRRNLLKVVLNKQTWPIALYSCLIWAPIAAFAGLWGIPFIESTYHIDTIGAAGMITWIWVGIGVGSPLIGWVSEKIQRRILPLFVVALIGLVALSCVIYIPHLSILLCSFLLFCVGLSASGQSLSFALITDINPPTSTSAAIGFNNMSIVCGAIISQPLIGQLLDMNWRGEMMADGVRNYSTSDFQVALFALPVCYLVCAVVSTYFLKETNCEKLNT